MHLPTSTRHLLLISTIFIGFSLKNNLVGQGCSPLATLTLNVVAAPQPIINAPSQICAGNSATLSVSTPFSSYLWNTGATTQTITTNNVGTFSVVVTNAAGCTGNDAVTIVTAPAPQPDIVAEPYACNGTLTLDAGAGYTNYSWSGGGSGGQTATLGASGTYFVTVTNAEGCTGVDNFVVSIPAAPSVSIAGNPAFCNGTTTTLTATAGFSTYFWSNGATTSSIVVGTTGGFSVTATNAAGCAATANVTTTNLPAPTPQIDGLSSICPNQTATFTVSGGSFQSFLWNTAATTASISTTMTGVYDVTVTAANGCTASDSQTLAVAPSLNPSIAEGAYACNSQLTLNATAGFQNYIWSNAATTASIVVTASGTFSVTVSDAAGCTGTTNFTATIPIAPSVSISGDNQICSGETSILTANGSFPAYLWSNGATSTSISTNAAGNFGVTATDALGCTATNSFSVAALPDPMPSIAGPSQICGSSSATFSVPNSFSSFLWSNSATTASITVNAAGTYSVTVTAANGCTGSDSQTLTLSTSLQPNITTQPYDCSGKITLDAGAGFSNYLWSGGQTTQTVAVGNGSFSVTVSDASGCSGMASSTVVVPAAPSVSIAGNSQICPNSTTILTATTGFPTYLWSNGQVGNSISVGGPSLISVTATDANGCTATANFTLSNSPQPQPQITGPSSICTNSTAILMVNQPFSSYLWSNTATTASISVSTAGQFSVTVTNASGCTGTASQAVSVSSSLSPTIVAQPYNCDGQRTLDAGSFQTFLWSNAATTQTITVSQSGSYAVTVSDAGGCSGSATIQITVPPIPQISISGDLKLCPAEITTLTATAGFQNYNWSNGATTASISTAASGPISVIATDANGCQASSTATLEALAAPQPTISGPSSICGNQTISLTVGGGVFSQIAWSTSATTASIQTNNVGNFVVTVTDSNGCTASTSQNVVSSGSLQATISVKPYACDGKITLDAGTAFTTFLWNNNATTQTITVSQSGSYAVTVSDGGGCSGTATIQITVPTASPISISGDLKLCPAEITTLAATAGFQNYLWSNGKTTASISVSTAGQFSVTATDANGCTNVATATTESLVPQPISISGDLKLCPAEITTLAATAGFSNYAWSNGKTTASISVNSAGQFSVTATDSNGCTTASSATVESLVPQPISISGDLKLCPAEITMLAATAGFQNYAWSNGKTTASISVSAAGQFSVTATDANGCTNTATATTESLAAPTPLLQTNESLCVGTSITIDVIGNFINFLWTGGSTQPSLVVSQIGTYFVTVTDANGCTGSASAEVLAVPPAMVSITGNPILCKGDQETLTTTGSAGSFVWSNGATGSQISIQNGGNFSVTVTDANGCTAQNSFIVVEKMPAATTLEQFSCRSAEVGTVVLPLKTTFGCDSLVTIITKFQATNAALALDLPAEIEAKYGQEISFSVAGNFVIDSIFYQSPYVLSCGDCLAPQLAPTEPGSIEVTAFDANGCPISGEILVKVSKKVAIYVPNAVRFESIANSFFTVFSGPEISSVKNFNVFNRWGEVIFSRDELPTNEPTAGWDGYFRGELVQPAVYVFYFEIEFPDGSTEIVKGDVTVVR